MRDLLEPGLAFAVSGVLVVGLLTAAVRTLRRSDRPGGSAMGDGLGNFIDVFDPGQARAARDLRQHHDAGPVSRIPDDDDDAPIRLLRNPDGSPRAVRIRRR